MAVHLFMHFQLLVIWLQITTQNSLTYLKLYALGVTNPPSQYTLGEFSLQTKELGCDTWTHFHPVPKLRMSGSIPLIPCISSWCADGQLYLHLCELCGWYLEVIEMCVLYLGMTFKCVNFKVWMRHQFCRDVLDCQRVCGSQHMKSM
jgi:hypothetical protein